MINPAEILFWFFAFVIFYTYFGYPILLFLVGLWGKQPVQQGPYEPSVSIILSAFNEEKNIDRKLQNLLELNYPQQKLEILVGSDGASDMTDHIISQFYEPQIRFFRFVKNLGKPHVLNELIKEARGSILVFTDVRQEIDQNAIRKLVRNFHDSRVGCVSGELCFRREGADGVEKGMDAYWKYEKFLRKYESKIGSMLGATGALYATRRRIVSPLPEDVLVDDMYIPLAIVAKGYRAIFESEARVYDQPSTKAKQEFTRKVRTLAGNYQIFYHFPGLFLPFRSPIAWQLFSHKFLRLTIPFFLIGLFCVNWFLVSALFYKVLLLAQSFFYGLAAVEALGARMGRSRRGVAYLPYTFCLLNYCALIGFVRFLSNFRRREPAAWEKAYA